MRYATPALQAALAAMILASARPASAQIGFDVFFDDPGAAHAARYDDIRSHLVGAAGDWASLLRSRRASSIEVMVRFDPLTPRASGGSTAVSYAGNADGISVFYLGAAAEIVSGRDPNAADPDILITLGEDYLANELWFDPDPASRLAPVPFDRTDAYSVFMHELGHGLVFNGWRDPWTGVLPGGYQSGFDRYVVSDGVSLFFAGPRATAVYGAPVPLTYGNYGHLGNDYGWGLPGTDLIPDVMNGVVFYRGTRYDISRLDRAILHDSGLPVASTAPEPMSLLLLATGAIPIALRRRRRK
jgi:hypothetical protein